MADINVGHGSGAELKGHGLHSFIVSVITMASTGSDEVGGANWSQAQLDGANVAAAI